MSASTRRKRTPHIPRRRLVAALVATVASSPFAPPVALVPTALGQETAAGDGGGGAGGAEAEAKALFPGGHVLPDGTCRLALVLPFTGPDGIVREEAPRSESFSQLAAGIMAMRQFNNRDASVVPQLASAPHMANCSVTFPIEATAVFNTEDGLPTAASSFLMGELRLGRPVCAIAGPWSHAASVEVATVAGGMDVPVALHHNIDVPTNKRVPHPTAYRTKADQFYQFDATTAMLRRLGRTDFMNILFVSKLSDQSLALESQARELGKAGLAHVRQHKIVAPFTGFVPNQSVRRAVYEMKKSGWRTVFVFLLRWGAGTNPSFRLLADAAEEFGMNGPGYTWFFQSDAPLHVLQRLSGTNSNVTKLLRGSGVIRQLAGFEYRAEGEDPFLRSWEGQGQDTLALVRDLYPVPSTVPGYYNASDTYFQNRPEWESGFFYDAVISIGMGACKAEFDAKKSAAGGKQGSKGKGNKDAEAVVDTGGANRDEEGSGANGGRRDLQKKKQKEWEPPENKHILGIVSSSFTGATGTVSFEKGKSQKRRRRETITYGLYNFKEVCNSADMEARDECSWKYVLTNVYLSEDVPGNGSWIEMPDGPFVFSNGKADPPPLTDEPEQNYLSNSVRIAGLALMSIAVFLVVVSTMFVAWNSSHQVIRASQPEFLYAFEFGALVMAMSILTISFDESYGWDESMLDAACIAFPWLISLGYILIYCAIFSKLWRINKVLEFHRRTVEISHVMGPFALFVLAAVVILSVWTAIDPFNWERTVINEDTLESYGRCQSNNFLAYAIPLMVLMFAVTALTAVMAYKTKDVDSSYSESSWIFYTISIQFQVLIVGIPIIVILNDASADAAYLGRVLVIWTIPMSTILLIVGPRVVTVLSRPKGPDRHAQGTGGMGAVSVPGLSRELPTSSFCPSVVEKHDESTAESTTKQVDKTAMWTDRDALSNNASIVNGLKSENSVSEDKEMYPGDECEVEDRTEDKI